MTGETANNCGYLLSEHGLVQGQSVSSCNGRTRLVLQTDGNVVLYKNPSLGLWATNTAVRPEAKDLVMQSDGNLVLYNGGVGIWASGTGGNPGAYLRVQDDGNVVIYTTSNQPIWATNTWVP